MSRSGGQRWTPCGPRCIVGCGWGRRARKTCRAALTAWVAVVESPAAGCGGLNAGTTARDQALI